MDLFEAFLWLIPIVKFIILSGRQGRLTKTDKAFNELVTYQVMQSIYNGHKDPKNIWDLIRLTNMK